MTQFRHVLQAKSRGFTPPPLRTITLRATRHGVQTAGRKTAELWYGFISSDQRKAKAIFTLHDGIGAAQTFVASAIDGPNTILLYDLAPPALAVIRTPTITDDVIYYMDINDGSGGGDVGAPALLAAKVRINNLPAAREVLAVERKTDGKWRIAGNLRTDGGELDLRVTGGTVYALAMDDVGVRFQPGIIVVEGDTIRPPLFAGWLYRITEAGTLPATEPEWWDETLSGPQPLGTARAEVVRYYRPLAHGPIPVETL